jgi:ABC-type transport system involved in cytochrome c biogenesis permease subunit
MIALIALAVSLESVILIFRAVAIQAVPLTGLFESMIVLTIVFGLTFLFLSAAVRQVWFGSVMAWLLFAMALLSALVAAPASNLQPAARTPWIAAHGLAMVLAGATIAFAAGAASLFLLARWKLKHKQIYKLIGKLPNIEKLEAMNIFALRASLVFMTFGLVTGIGLAVVKAKGLGVSVAEWLTDPKIVLIAVVWVFLAAILVLRHLAALRGKMVACMTVAAFVVILFAFVGTAVFCGTHHNFGTGDVSSSELGE